jgi:hypothetical protein
MMGETTDRTVLVVEDDEAMMLGLEENLKFEGYEVPEEKIVEAVALAQESIRTTIEMQKELIEQFGVQKAEWEKPRDVSALVADIRRHLQHEPVIAGPPSAAYRIRKFVRRNRAPVTAGAVIALALLVGAAAAAGGCEGVHHVLVSALPVGQGLGEPEPDPRFYPADLPIDQPLDVEIVRVNRKFIVLDNRIAVECNIHRLRVVAGHLDTNGLMCPCQSAD